MAFEDNFDGNALDRTKWATRYVYENGTLARLNDEEQRYVDNDNHRVAGGVLSLVARAARNGGGAGRYESGMIRSRKTFYYGYFEARVLLPGARGVWPAFWLNSDYTSDGRLSWPPEIDAFEFVINGTHEPPDMIHSSVMVGKTGAQDGSWIYRDPAFDAKWTFFKAAGPLNEGWQVIGLLWKPDSVSMYLNGRRLYTRAYKWSYDDGETAGPAHILLNLAVGGKWAGLNGVDDARLPQELKVDYVRVCRYSRAANGMDRCAGSPWAPRSSEGAYTAQADDLARTTLTSAEPSATSVEPGGRLDVKYAFDAVPSRKDHRIQTTLVDSNGKDLATSSMAPPVPTSRWRGLQVIKQSLTLPIDAAPGRYRLMVSIGAPPQSGASAGHGNIPLEARPPFSVADGQLRLAVGEILIAARSDKVHRAPVGAPPERD